MDFRDLGYPLVNEVPHNNCAITSLLAASNRKIYGATTGDTAYLFVFDPRLNKVRHLGRVAEAQSVHHALVEDGKGLIYIGTGLNPFTPLELSTGGTTLHVDRSFAITSLPGGGATVANAKPDSDVVLIVESGDRPDHFLVKLSSGVVGWATLDALLGASDALKAAFSAG